MIFYPIICEKRGPFYNMLPVVCGQFREERTSLTSESWLEVFYTKLADFAPKQIKNSHLIP